MCRSNGMLSADLLDANESTWAFAAIYRVDCVKNPLVSGLAALASIGPRRNYCGRIADAAHGAIAGEREREREREREKTLGC
jgi:hypothetical protein